MQQAMTLTEPSIEGSKPFPTWRPKMSIDEVLHAYTVAPAWQMCVGDQIGIEVGKYAGMAIFEKSLREIKPENLIEEAKCQPRQLPILGILKESVVLLAVYGLHRLSN